jgi:hypothetical protein
MTSNKSPFDFTSKLPPMGQKVDFNKSTYFNIEEKQITVENKITKKKKKKKKKKNKQSYKQMMNDILKPKETDINNVKKLEKVTGGGIPDKLGERL